MYSQCRSCNKMFSSVSAFDKHRYNNRCMTDEEMSEIYDTKSGFDFDHNETQIYFVKMSEEDKVKMREYWATYKESKTHATTGH